MDLSELKHLPVTDYAPAELDAPADCLLKAADWLEKYGLCQRGVTGHGGSGCVIHATWQVGYDWRVIEKAQALLTKAVRPWNIVGWNEDSGVTQAEVVAKLRAVAMGGA